MKTFDGLLLIHLKLIPNPHLNPLQFTYGTNSCVEELGRMGPQLLLRRPHSPGAISRIRYVDFNTIASALPQDK